VLRVPIRNLRQLLTFVFRHLAWQLDLNFGKQITRRLIRGPHPVPLDPQSFAA
jgi:hypothetical protein